VGEGEVKGEGEREGEGEVGVGVGEGECCAPLLLRFVGWCQYGGEEAGEETGEEAGKESGEESEEETREGTGSFEETYLFFLWTANKDERYFLFLIFEP